jgi:hypothetical protein
MSGIAFQNVAGLKPGRTRFDWHQSKKFDCEFGQIIPIFIKQTIPGDFWKIENQTLVRCTPLITPAMHEITIDTHYFFIPTRILDDCNSRPGSGNPAGDPLLLAGARPPADRFNWELFITGGFDGNDAQTPPRWQPSEATRGTTPTDWDSTSAPYKYSLWDYLEYPTIPAGMGWLSPITPLDFVRRAYNLIYNEYYRDETLIDPLPWTNEKIQLRAWRKDYFTSALPFQQRGISPALPLSGNLAVSGETFADFEKSITNVGNPNGVIGIWQQNQGQIAAANNNTTPNFPLNNALLGALNSNVIDGSGLKVNLGNGLTYDIADFRLTFQVQKWMERNARAGVRINEWTKAHWGVDLKDGSLFRPEYIGGTKTPLIISEVLQTSESSDYGTPQGNMAGHGISASESNVGDYNCNEYGYIIGLMTIMPTPAYCQGFDRGDTYETRFDWPQAEFVNLSEQDIRQCEIYIANNDTDTELFGYQGMYDELRVANSKVCGSFRDSLADWHLTRMFSNRPLLNKEFIECNPKNGLRRIFAARNSPGLLVDIEHTITAVRPIPEIAEPGLIDHH